MTTCSSVTELGLEARGGRLRARELGAVEERDQTRAVLFGDDATDFVQPGDQVVQHGQYGRGVVPAYVGPDGRRTGRDSGHVPEASGGQAQEGRVGVGRLGGKPHEGGRGQVGHVRDDGDKVVVAVGRKRHEVGTEAGDDGLDGGEGLRVGGRGRREHPGGTREQLRVGAVGALLLGAGHRMSTDKTGMRDLRHDRAFHPADVGDHELAGLVAAEKSVRLAGDGRDRSRHKGDRRAMVDADLVDGAQLTGAPRPGLVEISSRHPPTLGAQGQSDRGADETQPRHLCSRRDTASEP